MAVVAGFALASGCATPDEPLGSAVASLPSSGAPWARTYGEEGLRETLAHVRALPDGAGYVAVGGRLNEPADPNDHFPSTDGWVLRVDDKGDVVFQARYDVKGWWNQLEDVVVAREGGFLGVGRVYDDPGLGGLEYRDGWVLRLDDKGKVLWARQLRHNGRGADDDDLRTVIEVEDGFVVIGSTARESRLFAPQQSDILVAKLSHDGELLWTRTYSFLNDPTVHGRELPNAVVGVVSPVDFKLRLFIVGRLVEVFGSHRSFVLTIDPAEGAVVSSHIVQHQDYALPGCHPGVDLYGVTTLRDGVTSDLVFAGVRTDTSGANACFADRQDCFVARTNLSGSFDWQRSYYQLAVSGPANASEGCVDAHVLPNGSLTASGFIERYLDYPTLEGSSDLMRVNLRPDGNQLKSFVYGTFAPELSPEIGFVPYLDHVLGVSSAIDDAGQVLLATSHGTYSTEAQLLTNDPYQFEEDAWLVRTNEGGPHLLLPPAFDANGNDVASIDLGRYINLVFRNEGFESVDASVVIDTPPFEALVVEVEAHSTSASVYVEY